jgi:hypothetical protein
LSSAAAAGYRLWWKFPEWPMYVSAGDPATAVLGYGVLYILLRLEYAAATAAAAALDVSVAAM